MACQPNRAFLLSGEKLDSQWQGFVGIFMELTPVKYIAVSGKRYHDVKMRPALYLRVMLLLLLPRLSRGDRETARDVWANPAGHLMASLDLVCYSPGPP